MPQCCEWHNSNISNQTLIIQIHFCETENTLSCFPRKAVLLQPQQAPGKKFFWQFPNISWNNCLMINSISSNSYKKKSKTNQKAKPQPAKATLEENIPYCNIVTSNIKSSSLTPSSPMHSNTEWSGIYVFKPKKKKNLKCYGLKWWLTVCLSTELTAPVELRGNFFSWKAVPWKWDNDLHTHGICLNHCLFLLYWHRGA